MKRLCTMTLVVKKPALSWTMRTPIVTLSHYAINAHNIRIVNAFQLLLFSVGVYVVPTLSFLIERYGIVETREFPLLLLPIVVASCCTYSNFSLSKGTELLRAVNFKYCCCCPLLLNAVPTLTFIVERYGIVEIREFQLLMMTTCCIILYILQLSYR